MRYALSDYLEIYVTKWDELVEEFLRHLSMTSLAVLLALVIGVPLGIFITRHKKLSAVVIAVANVMQSIPCMALLALGIPVFGIGEKLAVFMVFVYAFLPILKNTYTGIAGISPVSLEVARGIGLTRAQQLTRVELPMAVPYVMSGIRIAAVSAVSTMTIAAFAGANGLGLHCGPADLCVRLRRRPGPGQAPPHGGSGRLGDGPGPGLPPGPGGEGGDQ